MSNKELLRCPFCGGEAKLWRTEDSFDSNGWYTEVICQHCNARTTGNEDEAIKAWNTRNYLEKQDSSKELMEFVKFCRNASATEIRQIHDRARDLIAEHKECCEKSCKDKNATCKENLQLTRSDIEKMVKLEWRDNRPMVADCGDFSLNIFYMRENEYTIYASKGILGGEMYIGTTKSEDEAKQKAQDWIVDIVCSALGVEEEK